MFLDLKPNLITLILNSEPLEIEFRIDVETLLETVVFKSSVLYRNDTYLKTFQFIK